MTESEDRETFRKILRTVVAVNGTIATSQDLSSMLCGILGAASSIIPCEAGCVLLLGPDRESGHIPAMRGYPEGRRAEFSLHDLGGGVRQVLRTGLPALQQPGEGGERGVLAAPISRGGATLGVLALEGAHFCEDDLERISVFASQASLAVSITDLLESIRESRGLEEELRIARGVQLSLLPKSAPQLEYFDIDGINLPSQAIGGDYFDFIPIVEGHIGIVIADVAGKGIPASLIMASFQAFLKAEIRNNYAIRTIFAKVNNLLKEGLDSNQFVSAFYGVLDVGRRRLTYSNAGHHPPILFRGAKRRRFLTSGGPVLGIFEGSVYNERFIDLLPGDLLVLYTDGVVEAENREGEQYGRERLETFAWQNAGLASRRLCESIYSEVIQFTGQDMLADDTTVVVLKAL